MNLAGLGRLSGFAESAPSRHLPWLPVQSAFLADPAKRKSIRAGNQFFGKTSCLVEEMLRRAEERHPDQQMTYPRQMLCISPSNPQSINIQQKLWQAADKRLLDPRTQFDPVNGFRGRYAACRWLNGTILLFKSAEAGAISFAGLTIDDAFIDEPTTLRIYQEADRRVLMRGGYVILGFTPINAREPLDWLRELVEAGYVSEHHTALTPESMIPVGHDEPRQTKTGERIDVDFIARQRKSMEGQPEAPIILDGDWETPVEGQAFPGFDPRVHIVEEVPPSLDLTLLLGIDHGERDHKQCAVLVGVESGGLYPAVWVLDEYSGEGLTTPEEDAEGILSMLGRWGWSWQDLEHAMGDKPHDVRRVTRSVGRKSNADLTIALARRLNRHPGQLAPPIRQAKKGAGGGRGSVDRGVRWLHTCMLRADGFHIHPRAEHTIRAIQRWAWKDDEHKDRIDALRYATWKLAMKTARILARAPTYRIG